MEAFYLRDHVGDGGGAGVAQKHGVLGFVAHGRGHFLFVPGGDVDDPTCGVVAVEDARVGAVFVPGAPAQERNF